MLVYMVALLTVVIGLCGLMLDLGMFELKKLQMQQAADAAASGAIYSFKDGGTFVSGGLADAQSNGFISGQNNVTVTISNPPLTGAYVSNSSAVQATISAPVKSIFLPSNYTMTAKATAFMTQAPCVYLLSQSTAQHTLTAHNQTLTGSCPFYIANSFDYTGSGGPQFYVAGPPANSYGTVTSPAPIYGASVMGDPLSYLAQPSFGSCQYFNTTITGPATLPPGTYCGGLNINTSQNVTLKPGVYVIAGNLVINGPQLTASGVTIFMTQGGGYSSGTAMIENINGVISAPTTGLTQGIFFFSDRSLAPTSGPILTMQYWNPGATLDGILYLANQQLVAIAGVQSIHYLGIVAASATMHNTNFTNNADFSSLANGNPMHPVGGSGSLVE